MSSSVVIDAQARQQAVDASRSYIVQAPAGSGKTELLTDRILSLLLKVERPEDVLSITFTRKAAAEMRDRVIKKLNQAFLPEPSEDYLKASWQRAKQVLERDQELAWHLLDNPNRLRIQTIDSFCQSIVHLTPSLSGTGGGLKPTESASSLREKAAQKVIDQADTNACVAYVIAHLDVDVEKFKRLLVSMLDRRDSWLPFIGNPKQALMLMAKTLNDLVSEYLMAANTCLPNDWLVHVKDIIIEAANVLEEDSNKENFLRAWMLWDGKDIDTTIDDIELWHALADFLTTQKGVVRKTIDVKSGVAAKSTLKPAFMAWLKNTLAVIPGINEKLAQIKKLPAQLFIPENQIIMENFFECLQVAEQASQEVFRQEGEVDFSEVAQRALSALGSQEEPTELLLKIDTRLQHILIDEFQDTSFSQKRLLDLMVSGWEKNDGRTLFLVGDPMQSIYRFRQAEVGLFLEIAHAAAANHHLSLENKQPVVGNVVLDLLQLQENFRSDAGVVQWVNRSFSAIFPEEDNVSLGVIRYSKSHAFKQAKDEPAVQYYPYRYEFTLNDPDAMIAKDRAQDRVVSLAQEALERQRGKEHPVAILVRSRRHIEDIFDKLKAANIPVNAIDMVPLGRTEEVVDIMQLVRALSHTGDRLAWMSLLRAPFCGLRLSSLTRLFEDEPDKCIPHLIQEKLKNIDELIKSIGHDDSKRLVFISKVLLGERYSDSDLSFASYVEQCWQQLGGNTLYASEAQQENIQEVLTVVDTLAPYGNLDTAAFERRIEALYAKPSNQDDSVEIMTMHKSKGLEFKEVILYGLHSRSGRSDAALLEIESEKGKLLLGTIKHQGSDVADPTSVLISERNNLRQQQETKRLLYVACTRAEEKIHLVYLQKKNSRANKNAMLSEIEDTIDPSLIVDNDDIVSDVNGGKLGADGLLNRYETRDHQDEPKWAFNNSLLKRYTLDTIERLSRDIPEIDDYSRQGTAAWPFTTALHAAIGTVTHAWLEQMGADKLKGWTLTTIQEAGGTIERQLRQLGVARTDRQASAQRVQSLLSNVLKDEKGKWLLSHPNATQEWRLFNKDGQEKRLDLVLDTTEAWWVVDYKTNQRHPEESVEDFRARLLDEYAEQLNTYADYIRALDNRPVRMALYAIDGCQWIEL